MKILRNISLVFAVCGLLAACATTTTGTAGGDFGPVKGKVWQLLEVTSGSEIIFARSNMDKTMSDGFFTLQFEDGRASGKGAPNRFFGPYTAKTDGAITFGPAAATLMMGIYTPPGLSEHEFFGLLNRASGWKFDYAKMKTESNYFTLYSTDESGAKVTMLFTEFDYR